MNHTQNGWENSPRFFQFWGGLGHLFHSDLGTDRLEGVLLHMSLVFDNPLDFLKYSMYSPIRSESKLCLNQSLIMASQPTPPNVLPQK